jgi:hypothetical protein
LTWRAVEALRDPNGAERHVGLEPPAEAAADQVVVDGHLLERHAEELGDGLLDPGLDLRSDPDAAAVASQLDGAVHRFHRRVREQGNLELGFEAIAARKALLDVAELARHDAGLPAGDAKLVPHLCRGHLRVRTVVPLDLERLERLLRGPHVVADHATRSSRTTTWRKPGTFFAARSSTRRTLPPSTGLCAIVANFMPGSIASMP